MWKGSCHNLNNQQRPVQRGIKAPSGLNCPLTEVLKDRSDHISNTFQICTDTWNVWIWWDYIKGIKEGQNKHKQLSQELLLNRFFTGPIFFNLAIYGKMWQWWGRHNRTVSSGEDGTHRKKNLLNFHFLTSCFATGTKYEVTCLGQQCGMYQNQSNGFRKALHFILREEERV